MRKRTLERSALSPASALTLDLALALALSLGGCSGEPLPGETADDPAAGVVAATATNPLAGKTFYVDKGSAAASAANAEKVAATKALYQKIAGQPQAVWLTDWVLDKTALATAISNHFTAAMAQGALPVFVAYNIVQRDVSGGASSGGAKDAATYQAFITNLATDIGTRAAVVILEPDALADMDPLTAAAQTQRKSLLRAAVTTLKAPGKKITVYIDAGNSSWHTATDMAARLNDAGVATADGFSLNVSNYRTQAETATFGQQLSSELTTHYGIAAKHFVVDTSRNGVSPAPAAGVWCNPAGRALGVKPTPTTGNALIDAYLWIKRPGESDGACGDLASPPAAGVFFPAYAQMLAKGATW